MTRALRRWITRKSTAAALRFAPYLGPRSTHRLTALIAQLGPHLPVLGAHIARNMRALDLYTPPVHREYFRQLAGHFAGALQALHCAALPTRGTTALAAFAAERVALDASVERLPAAAARGRGVILVGPHIANYLLNLTHLNAWHPLTIYLRHSRDSQRLAAKARWYAASGVQWISEPADAGGALGRLGRMSAALAAGRTLFITPDLPQKPADGEPVSFFDRRIYLPGGAALLAVRSGAPLLMLTARRGDDGRQLLCIDEPFSAPVDGRGRAARRATVTAAMQWFADGFANFLRAEPALWYLWGDKRWTRVLRGDARYAEQPAAHPGSFESPASAGSA